MKVISGMSSWNGIGLSFSRSHTNNIFLNKIDSDHSIIGHVQLRSKLISESALKVTCWVYGEGNVGVSDWKKWIFHHPCNSTRHKHTVYWVFFSKTNLHTIS